MTYLEEIKAIKSFVAEHEYPLSIDLFKENKVRVIDMIHFLQDLEEKRNYFIMNDKNCIFEFVAVLLNMNAIHEYEQNTKTELTGILHENHTYHFYFKKNKLSNKYHTITVKRKPEEKHEYELLTGPKETTYPDFVALEFLRANVHVRKTADVDEDTDIMQVIDHIEEERLHYMNYDSVVDNISTIASSSLSDQSFHYFQIQDGSLEIYCDKNSGSKSILSDFANTDGIDSNELMKLSQQYFEKQVVSLSDFKNEAFELAIKNYIMTMLYIRSKEDDGMKSYELFLTQMKENKSTFAGFALNELMTKQKKNPTIAINTELMEKIETIRMMDQQHFYLNNFSKEWLHNEKEKEFNLKVAQINEKAISWFDYMEEDSDSLASIQQIIQVFPIEMNCIMSCYTAQDFMKIMSEENGINQIRKNIKNQEKPISTTKRFMYCLVLYQILTCNSLEEVLEKYHITDSTNLEQIINAKELLDRKKQKRKVMEK